MVALTPWAMGWIVGTAVQLQQAQLWAAHVYLSLLACAVCVALVRWRIALCCQGLAFVVATASAFALTGIRASHYLETALKPELEGQTLRLVGVVANMPQRMADGARFRFDVASADTNNGTRVDLPPQLLLGWYGNPLHDDEAPGALFPANVMAGDRWQLSVRLKTPHGHINPHGFDYELWLWEQGLQATGYVRNGVKDRPPQFLGHTWAHPVERLRQRVRGAIDTQVADHATAGIVAALLVGDQAAIERADWDVFRATGVAHLMAISGLHITGLAWVAAGCMGWLWRRSDVWSAQRPWSLRVPAPLAASLAAVWVAMAYAVFTGWGVPAQRTVWMLAAVTLLRWHGVRWPWPQVWLCACALVLAMDPWAFLQAGFWLSFVAVGVLFASGSSTHVTTWRGSVHRLCREQWLMSVCLAPLSLVLFHQISVVGMFANLLAVPWVTLLVTPLCLLGVVWPHAWSWAADALQLLVWMLKAFSQVSWAQWSAPAAPEWAGEAALVGVGLLALRVPLWVRCLGMVWVLPVLTWQVSRPAQGRFELLAADMGQGHAVLIRTATHSVLYDAGPRYSAETDAGQRVLVPLLRAWGERLDRIIISHQDNDHSGGASAVMAMQAQADVWTSIAKTHPLQQQGQLQRCERGQSWVWDGVRFDMLHPSAADYARQLKPNALSCVLRVSTSEGSALLAGDIEAPQEKTLVDNGLAVPTDWLLVPHHGSATSSTAVFLNAVHPRVAVVQAGYRNRFGHPRPEVMQRYADLEVFVVQTTRCGASTWRSDQPDRVQCERHQRQRYWQHMD